MAQESIDNYLSQLFKGRRYCPTCRAMTPVLQPSPPKPGAVATSGLYMEDTCECCRRSYKLTPLSKLRIQETYGMAIFSDQATKAARSAHKHS